MASLGTFKNTGSGITLSRRGAGVLLSVSFKELEVWARANGVDEKKLWARSYGRAIRNIKSKFGKVIRNGGGVEGVPKFKDFESFTNELRAATGRSTPMGGVLANKANIIAYKRGNTQYIGWPDRLAEWAVKFQDGTPSKDFADNSWRHYVHKLGVKDIPTTYNSNPRRVLPEPFLRYVRRNLDDWAKGAYYKELARQMAKKRIGAA